MALTPISAVARKLPIFDRRLLFRTFLARLKTLLFVLSNEKKNCKLLGLLPLFLTILGHCDQWLDSEAVDAKCIQGSLEE